MISSVLIARCAALIQRKEMPSVVVYCAHCDALHDEADRMHWSLRDLTVKPFVLAVVVAVATGQVDSAHAESNIARKDFITLCADCHNADAKGNGPLAKNLTKIPPDLTRIKQRAHGKFDEKAVYDWILGLKMTGTHGSREMPIWGDWLMDETIEGNTSLEDAKAAEQEIERRVMGIVRYLESLQTEK